MEVLETQCPCCKYLYRRGFSGNIYHDTRWENMNSVRGEDEFISFSGKKEFKEFAVCPKCGIVFKYKLKICTLKRK
jgi:hypothetical protein